MQVKNQSKEKNDCDYINLFLSAEMDFKTELAEKGYCVIENILSSDEVESILNDYRTWLDSNDQIKGLHNKISPHGIFKQFQAGNQRHAWRIRTHPNVQNVFKTLWNTEELVVSLDGSCWIPADVQRKDNIWTHTDQAPSKDGLRCYQAFVALTSNIERTLVVYEGTHLLHNQYAKDRNLTSTKDWLLIDHDYLQKIQDKKRALPVKEGSLVVWDSRTFHQNQYGTLPEERIVQYVSYLPKAGRSPKMLEKRKKYFIEGRTTSHWPYPVKVNGQQPQTYGKKELIIDYSTLQAPDLDDLMIEIEKLL